jgi:hypothetical protein
LRIFNFNSIIKTVIERGFEPVSPYKKDEAMLRSYKTLVYLTQKNQLYRATSLEREREREREQT